MYRKHKSDAHGVVPRDVISPHPTPLMQCVNMAVWNRRPKGNVVHHSDHGSQYTALILALRKASIRPSMGSVGDAWPWQEASLRHLRRSRSIGHAPDPGLSNSRVHRGVPQLQELAFITWSSRCGVGFGSEWLRRRQKEAEPR